MKKIVFIGIVLIIIIILIMTQIYQIQKKKRQAQQFNEQYEYYQNKDLYGIDVVTIMNKAIDNNTKYQIPKDEKGMYKEDEEHSIKVELELIAGTDEKTGEYNMVIHPMERIQEAGVEGFITNFNLTTFRCKTIEYHKKTGKVSKIVLEQIEL